MKLMEVFSYLPFGAIIQNNILCIHGGLSQEFTSIDQIRLIEKPVQNYDDYPILPGFFWSDPSNLNEDHFEYLPSPRNIGELFGAIQVSQFLNFNGLKLIIRAHEWVQNGIET
jgi:diadenosine tetraphosphatase ApaH/serine/threonine PP2A family protein phosphatase